MSLVVLAMRRRASAFFSSKISPFIPASTAHSALRAGGSFPFAALGFSSRAARSSNMAFRIISTTYQSR